VVKACLDQAALRDVAEAREPHTEHGLGVQFVLVSSNMADSAAARAPALDSRLCWTLADSAARAPAHADAHAHAPALDGLSGPTRQNHQRGSVIDAQNDVVKQDPRQQAALPKMDALFHRLHSWLLVLVPLLALPCLLIEPDQPAVGRTAFSITIMAAFWAFEVLPIAVTALLPLVLFPLLGVMPAEEVAVNYFRDKNVLFFGGLVVAAALEAVRAHERLALSTLLLFGTQPRQLLLGFMLVTGFLSMWLNNTATCAMMIPIGESVTKSLEAQAADRRRAQGGGTGCGSNVGRTLGKALMLGIAWAANIGGMVRLALARPARALCCTEFCRWFCCQGTLTGTGPNIVLAGGVSALYPSAPGLSFASWMIFAIPVAALCLLLAWVAIATTHLPPAALAYDPADTLALLREHHRRLSPLSFREACVLADFALLALLWISRKPGFILGWGEWFGGYATDATSAALMATLLFALPADPPRVLVLAADGLAPVGRMLARGRRLLFWRCRCTGQSFREGAARGGAGTAVPPRLRSPGASVGHGGAGLGSEGGCLDGGGRGAPSLELEKVRLASCDSAARAEEGEAAGEVVGELCSGGAQGAGRDSAWDGANGRPAQAAALAQRSKRRSADAPALGAMGSSPSWAAPAGADTDGGPLVTWPQIQSRVPWGVLLLLGGGFALADACQTSGLSLLLGAQLAPLARLPPTLVLLLLMLAASAATTFTSNVATASILLPVVGALAATMRVHPLFFLVPTTLTTSLAFVLPVSTPPNALAFASGRLRVVDMAPLGVALNLGCVIVVLGATAVAGDAVFGTATFPEWAESQANVTITAAAAVE